MDNAISFEDLAIRNQAGILTPEKLATLKRVFDAICYEFKIPLAAKTERNDLAQKILNAAGIIEILNAAGTIECEPMLLVLPEMLWQSIESIRGEMNELDRLAQWQATMDLAVYKFEQRTGLSLAGLAPTEIAQKIHEWAKVNQMRNERPFQLQRYETTDRPGRLNS